VPVVVYAVVFLDTMAVSTIQLLQPYYALSLGVGLDLVTMVAAAFTAAQFIGAPLWGRASDIVGRRPALLVALAGGTLASLLLLIVDTLPALVAVRALSGSMSLIPLVATACIADALPPDRRARGIANIGVAGGLGYIVGPALAGNLVGPATAGDGASDFGRAFYAAASASACAWVLTAAALRETAPRGTPMRQRSVGRVAALRGLLARPQFGLVVVLVFVPPAAGALIEPVLALWTRSAFGWGPERLGYVYSLMGVAVVVAQGVLVTPAIARFGTAGAAALSAGALGAASLWLILAGTDVEVMAAIALLIVGMATGATALTTHVTRLAEPSERGTLLGICGLSSGLGRIVGPAAGGPLYANVAATAPFVLALGIAMVMAVLSLRLKRSTATGRSA
jgi:MFS family permease